MNPEFTEFALNSFIFVMDIFYTNSERKFDIIDITYDASSCLLYFDFVNKF